MLQKVMYKESTLVRTVFFMIEQIRVIIENILCISFDYKDDWK